MPTIRLAAAAALVLLPATAGAQTLGGVQLLQERNIPLIPARQVAQAAVGACASREYNVTTAVVDRAGVVRVLLRANQAGVATPDSATDKAFTSAVLRESTSALAQSLQDRPRVERLLNQAPGILLLGGGLPVRLSSEIIGGVGVGGAPSGQTDEECARAGITAAGLGLS